MAVFFAATKRMFAVVALCLCMLLAAGSAAVDHNRGRPAIPRANVTEETFSNKLNIFVIAHTHGEFT